MKFIYVLAFGQMLALTGVRPFPLQAQEPARTTVNPAMDIDSYADLKQAIAATGSSPRTLQISKKWATGSLEIPPGVTLEFFGGGLIEIASGATVTIRGALGHPPLRQIFAASGRNDGSPGSGSVKFSAGVLAEAYSVWWGDSGDGSSDASDAINAAISSNAKIIWILEGTHLINRPINLANSIGGRVLRGVGRSYNQSTQIAANTGAVAIDCTGSDNVIIQDLRITTQPQVVKNPSIVGILYGRTARNLSAGANTIDNVQVTIASNNSANHGQGSVAVYDDESEEFRANSVDLRADTPIVFTRNNVYNIVSDLAKTDDSARSMGDAAILGGSELYSLGKDKSALVIQGGTNIALDETYLVAPRAAIADTVAAVSLMESHRVTLRVMIEGYGRAIYANNLNQSLTIEGTFNSPRSSYVFLDGMHPGQFGGPPGITDGLINLVPFGGTSFPYPVIETSGRQRGITNTQIHIPTGGSINAPGGPFTGNILFASSGTPAVTSLAGSSSFLVLGSSGINAGGSLFSAFRIGSQGATALASGDLRLGPGWGSGATVSSIDANDQRGRFTISSAGTGQVSNPTVTLNFKDGPWPKPPFAVIARNGGAQPAITPLWSTNTTSIVVTFPGTPKPGEKYSFEFIVME
ncbi:MAG: hypothetical protein JOZ48_14320 [Acidobacteriaceae bacterium]|nr:hypothetical protein [Acidobacteriaceae bacterium]